MKKVLAFAVILGVVVAGALIASQVILPGMVEERLAGAIAGLVPHHDRLTVHVTSYPAFRLLGGWIDGIAIDLVQPRIDGVTLAWLALRGERVRVDVQALRDRALVIREADAIQVEVALNEAQLTRYLGSQLPQVTDIRVELTPGAVIVHGAATVLAQSLNASVSGRIEPIGGTRLRFVPEDITVQQQAVPELLVRAVGSLWEWELDLSFLPFAVQVDAIHVEPGVIIAKGSWDEER